MRSLDAPESGAVSAILLDFDGLILDTEMAEFAALEQVLGSQGSNLAFNEWRATVGQASPDWLSRTAEPGSDRHARLTREVADRQRALVETQELLPGVRDLLDRAQDEQLAVAVVTSGTRMRVGAELRRLGVLERLDALVTFEDVSATKPDPEPYLLALARLGVNADQALAFEDSAHGVAAALGAGICCVAVFNDVTRDQDFSSAVTVVDRLDRLDPSVLFRRDLWPWS